MRRPLLATVSALLVAGCAEEVAGSPLAARVPAAPEIAPEPAVSGEGPFVFDEFALEGDEGVKKILVENYNVPAEDIDSVDCPPDQDVVRGSTFECVVTIGGEENTVKITVVNDDGLYEVATPEPQ